VTPLELQTYARQQYNATTDEFYSDDELYQHIWAAEQILATEGLLIERVYTTTTVVDQQEYSYPTDTIAIKRVTYDGVKLVPISFREDDTLTLGNAATTATGSPQFYALWNRALYLRPIPDDDLALKIFSYNKPTEVSAASTLEIDEMWHLAMADYLLWKMASKDKNFEAAGHYKELWDKTVYEARKWGRKQKRTDGFHSIKDEEAWPSTFPGVYG
jgi:hypothetical protein